MSAPTSSMEERIEVAEASERRAAVRALLAHPLLTSSASGELALVRRHATWLRDFFAEQAGWTLHVERELARLGKTAADTSDGSRPARASDTQTPFSRRRYVLLCLALAALERMDRQTTLQRIAEKMAELAADDFDLRDTGFELTLVNRDQRRDVVAVIRVLLGLELIARVQGDEDAFVQERGDALYRVDHAVLARLLDVRRAPSTVEATTLDDRIRSIVEESHVDSDDARRRALRHGIARRLLDDPIVYYAELSEAEREYLQRSRSAILPQLEAATGLVAEIRAEGIALTDPEHELTDLSMPDEGTDGHVALLLAEHLSHAAKTRPGMMVSMASLEAHIRDLTAEHAKYWRKAAREPGGEVLLVKTAVEILAGLKLVRCRPDGVVPMPAIARFALSPPRIEPRGAL